MRMEDLRQTGKTETVMRAIQAGFCSVVWMSVEDILFLYPDHEVRGIHGKGMQGRALRAFYARIEPWGA